MISFFSFFHLYGLLIGLGVVVGYMIVERQSRYFEIDPQWMDRLFFFVAIPTLIGARVYHLITDWQLYTHASFIDLIAVWRGGLGFLGAIGGGLVGLLFFVFFTHKEISRTEKEIFNPSADGQFSISKRISKVTFLFTILDLLSFGIPIAQAIGRLGNYVNGELYGLPTTLPWGIMINGQRYHPLFAYEAILNVVLFFCLLRLSRGSLKSSTPPSLPSTRGGNSRGLLALGKGQYFSLYLFGYGLIRFWLEYLRIDTARMNGVLGMISIAQWVCVGLMIGGLTLFWIRRHAPRKEWDWSLE
ncbi:prolipoprotein diacylglyceryl transferase [Candidatus Cerribacteria bacterium 'Amazon FNV 2010 28 9']|uniref:Phosphatidylglycerol--prolipoprotein diacylglyceryl transferase n=1 Tax=Candidatus Cerribacteria bacterium 'Amazon FNV 2010 28 9' TaxID=2081795 RepID=A0A317JMY8_9BACT|nr:MAG: prolipoprotein diacylglyceryl transferase [Candidatus Cerribacteria bacterium 'Amazon FNV 2010 28 9']